MTCNLLAGQQSIDYFTGMDDKDALNAMEEEVRRLHQQLQQQQRDLAALYRQINDLRGEAPAPVRIQQPALNLENFIGLRLIHLIGIIVLVIGLSIGVKYAIDRNLISEFVRIGLAYAAGAVLFFLSVRLKKKYQLFSAILFSGAMASLYFTTYGAFVYYGMMPFATAFILMALLTVFTVLQALRYNRQEIALLGLVGAYAIPFLISSNTENPFFFFLYVAVINCGMAYLVWSRNWIWVRRAAEAITWLLLLAWTTNKNVLQHLLTGAFFSGFFFFLFTCTLLLPAIIRKQKAGTQLLTEVVLNNLMLYLFMLLLMSMLPYKNTGAGVTILMSLFLAAQAFFFHNVLQSRDGRIRLLTLSFMLFCTFIALYWTGITVTMLWLFTSVVLFTVGVLKKWRAVRMAAIVLMGVTLAKLVLFDSLMFTTVQKVIAYLALGVLLLVVSYYYQRYKEVLFPDNEQEA
jgi:uncharacterized membrane protein